LGLPRKDWNAIYAARRAGAEAAAERRTRERLARRQPGTKPSREPAAYAGVYEHPAYGRATVRADGDTLTLAWSSSTLRLKHFHFDTFTVQGEEHFAGREVVFALGGDGEVRRLTFLGQLFLKRSR
jgi:hypothetical protein